jgi:Enoyl-CoA hydratase/isomerase
MHAAAATTPEIGYALWRDEYRLNARIASFPKPVCALMHGIVLGGGVGLVAHASMRIVTDTSTVGRPEVGIGMVPDVGGTWLRSRAPGEVGTHLALTSMSARLGARGHHPADRERYRRRAPRRGCHQTPEPQRPGRHPRCIALGPGLAVSGERARPGVPDRADPTHPSRLRRRHSRADHRQGPSAPMAAFVSRRRHPSRDRSPFRAPGPRRARTRLNPSGVVIYLARRRPTPKVLAPYIWPWVRLSKRRSRRYREKRTFVCKTVCSQEIAARTRRAAHAGRSKA